MTPPGQDHPRWWPGGHQPHSHSEGAGSYPVNFLKEIANSRFRRAALAATITWMDRESGDGSMFSACGRGLCFPALGVPQRFTWSGTNYRAKGSLKEIHVPKHLFTPPDLMLPRQAVSSKGTGLGLPSQQRPGSFQSR